MEAIISDETRIKLDKLLEEYNSAAFELLKAEARKNNPYNVGDIIEDHYQTGKIKAHRFQISVQHRAYSISYSCERLNKQLKPYKGGELTTIYLCNFEKLIKKAE